MDVAGGARTATAAQGKHFVDAVVADHFHHRKARLARDHAFFPFAGDDDKCGHAILLAVSPPRSDERRVGKECGSTCRSRWSPYNKKKKKYTEQQRREESKRTKTI